MKYAGNVVLALLISGCTNQPAKGTSTTTTGGPQPQAPAGAVPPPTYTAPPATPSTPPGPFREGIELSDSQLSLDHGLVSKAFNFGHLRDLWVRLRVAGMPNVGQFYLKLSDPNGMIGYEATVMFSPDPGMNQMDLPGAMHAVTVYHAVGVPGGFILDYAVPVSGG